MILRHLISKDHPTWRILRSVCYLFPCLRTSSLNPAQSSVYLQPWATVQLILKMSPLHLRCLIFYLQILLWSLHSLPIHVIQFIKKKKNSFWIKQRLTSIICCLQILLLLNLTKHLQFFVPTMLSCHQNIWFLNLWPVHLRYSLPSFLHLTLKFLILASNQMFHPHF